MFHWFVVFVLLLFIRETEGEVHNRRRIANQLCTWTEFCLPSDERYGDANKTRRIECFFTSPRISRIQFRMARILKKQRDATEISTSKRELVDPSNFRISGKFVLLVQDIDGNSTKSFYLVRKYFLDFSELLFIGRLLSSNCINSFKNFRKWIFIFFYKFYACILFRRCYRSSCTLNDQTCSLYFEAYRK